MNMDNKPLRGIQVLELSNDLSVAACGFLLSELGAQVSYLVPPDHPKSYLQEPHNVETRIRTHGKTTAHFPEKMADDFFKSFRVIINSNQDTSDNQSKLFNAYLPHQIEHQVICSISPQGIGWPGLSEQASDVLMQAMSGLMAVSGLPLGKPEFARAPIAQMSAAVISALSIMASLFSDAKQLIDLSVMEIMADQLRTHISLISSETQQTFRLGCGHPLCSPWDVYQAKDGWVIICASSDDHWYSLLKLMNVEHFLQDSRFSNVTLRRNHKVQVDEIVTTWTSTLSVAQVVEQLRQIGMPCGPALNPRDVPKDKDLLAAGTIEHENHLSFVRTPIRITQWDKGRELKQVSVKKILPLEGIKVIEFTAYAAGPMAGYLLASLGAEVIKIEPPKGEEGRKFKPQFGGASGYFINYNAGKKSIEVNLQDADNKKKVNQLINSADVVLHNMRPGAMDKLGFGIQDVMKLNSSLIYCAISGYGSDGPKLAALDTVIQGHLGLTGLLGDGHHPIRIGYSIADQLSGHYAAAGVIAALINRKHSQKGQLVDIAMSDAIGWLTQLTWNESDALINEFQIEATDGWVVSHHQVENYPKDLNRQDLVQYLKIQDIEAAPVLEIDEVIHHQSLKARGFYYQIKTHNDDKADLISPPLGQAVFQPEILFALGSHNYLLNTSI
jgi:crotonobetainyl-CoA:carnitine CoA-transferase CaiB-like acyl-CoA transferase